MTEACGGQSQRALGCKNHADILDKVGSVEGWLMCRVARGGRRISAEREGPEHVLLGGDAQPQRTDAQPALVWRQPSCLTIVIELLAQHLWPT